jgi:hypothetical protein
MLKAIAVVVGSCLLSVVLVLATDPLLSRLFPGDFVKGRGPSDTALIASTALFVVVSILCAWLCPALLSSAPRVMCSGSLSSGKRWVSAQLFPTGAGWPHWYWLFRLVTGSVSCWIPLLLAGRRADPPSA